MIKNTPIPDNMKDYAQCWYGPTIQHLMLDDSSKLKFETDELAGTRGIYVIFQLAFNHDTICVGDYSYVDIA